MSGCEADRALQREVTDRLLVWPPNDDPWMDEPWPFAGPWQPWLIHQPWLLDGEIREWAAAHGSPAVLLGLRLRIAPLFLARVLGDLARHPPLLDYPTALRAGPGSAGRQQVAARWEERLPPAIRLLRWVDRSAIGIGEHAREYRQGALAGAWELYWHLELERRVPGRAERALQAIARREHQTAAGSRHRWQQSYHRVLVLARTTLDWCPGCGRPGTVDAEAASRTCPRCHRTEAP